MKYQLTVNGVVVQTQRSPETGFIECDESVYAGMLFDGTTYSQPPPIPPTKSELKTSTKKEAQKRIIAIEANWNDVNYVVKQLNALMGAVGFVFSIVSRADANGGLVALTQADRDTAASLQSKESQIKAIRAASNLIEADIDAGKILTEQDVASSSLWT